MFSIILNIKDKKIKGLNYEIGARSHHYDIEVFNQLSPKVMVLSNKEDNYAWSFGADYNIENDNKIFLDVNTIYKKKILSKDSTGKITSYQLEIEALFIVKSTNKKIRISEKKIIDSRDDKFEETRKERSIKQSFAYSISNKFKSELINTK